MLESYRESKDLLTAMDDSIKQLQTMEMGDLIKRQVNIELEKALETNFIFAPEDVLRYLYFLMPDDVKSHTNAKSIAKLVGRLH